MTAVVTLRLRFNMKQVGGDHYQNTPYELWDFAEHVELPFNAANAIKYMVRLGLKDLPAQELGKCKSYIEKAIEHGYSGVFTNANSQNCKRFINQFPEDSYLSDIITSILLGGCYEALSMIDDLILNYEHSDRTIAFASQSTLEKVSK